MRRRYHPARLLVAAACTALASVPATAAVQVGQSGWNWSNPQPQGRTILDIAPVDATHAYASGDSGTLLSTADGGETWAGIPTSSTLPVGRVASAGPNTFVTASNCVARRSDDGGVTLRRMPFNTGGELACSATVQGLAFSSPTSGLIMLSDGTVFATSDGGQTFSRRAAIPGANAVTHALDLAMNPTTPATALAITPGTIHRTTDGGLSWSTVLTGGPAFRSVTFADGATAYAVGGGTAVYKSTDGGATWAKLTAEPAIAPALELFRVRCADANVCLMTTDLARVARTTDGGTTFGVVTPGAAHLSAVALLSSTRAIAAGVDGATFVSDDAGATWRQIGRRLGARMFGLRTNPDGFTYVWGPQGSLATSADGGVTWREPGVATAASLRSASFATPEVGYALDRAGTLLKTGNGGISWQILDTGAGFTPVDVFAVTPERLVVLGAGGALRRSADGGQTFSIAGTPLVRPIARRGERAGGTVVLYGQRAIAISTNAGATWRIVNGPSAGRTRLVMRTAQCPSVLTCWAATTNRRLFKTVNGGRTWVDVSAAAGNTLIASLRFTNRNTGYAALAGSFDATAPDAGGWVLRTVDGGASWIPELVSRGIPLQLTSGGGSDYALDGEGNVFTTALVGGLRGVRSTLTLTAPTRAVRPGTRVTLNGRLTPPQGGERIVISASDGRSRAVTAAANGRFSTTLLVTRTTSFVAQWGGDAARTGDGSLVVTVRRR